MSSATITSRRAIMAAALTLIWCGLWGSISFANVASGVVVSVALLAAGFGLDGLGGIRFAPLVQLGWLVLVDLARSTVAVAYETLTPTNHTNEAIIAVDLPKESVHHQLLLVTAITLTPGTAVVEADGNTGRLYLHLLHAENRAATEAHTHRLADLACRALPSPAEKGSP